MIQNEWTERIAALTDENVQWKQDWQTEADGVMNADKKISRQAEEIAELKSELAATQRELDRARRV